MNDRFCFDGIPGGEKNTAFLESAFGHGFCHHIDIGRMVEMAVGNNNRTQFFGIQLKLGDLHNTTRAGVH